MKRPRSHQVDELAQRIFSDALPPTWVANKQGSDYAKDYLVEIGDDNGNLTGASFLVQLKGQEQVSLSKDRKCVTFSLETKHARYYLDKVSDLPVFLVVVDVTNKKAWYQFVQPILHANQAWRKRKSKTIYLPLENDLQTTAALAEAVLSAKRRMRLLHPESIHDAVAAHKGRIIAIDPRFDITVSLDNETPCFHLTPKEIVPLELEFLCDSDITRQKIVDFVERGSQVEFLPGEVSVKGSKLFDDLELQEVILQCSFTLPGAVTLICLDSDCNELARLSELPGDLMGGRSEARFEGQLARSPLSLDIAPIAPHTGGGLSITLDFKQWNGQPLLHLGFFDRLVNFFNALSPTSIVRVELLRDGNVYLVSDSTPLAGPSVDFYRKFFGIIHKARHLCRLFGMNPAWDHARFDAAALDEVELLYSVICDGEYRRPAPGFTLKAECNSETFSYEKLRAAQIPGTVAFTADYSWSFLGETVSIGRLSREFSEAIISLNKRNTVKQQLRVSDSKKDAVSPRQPTSVPVLVKGKQSSMMTMRMANPENDVLGQQ